MLSRYRRARKLIGSGYESDTKMVEQLPKSKFFDKIPKTVQGQLLHACQLHAEYLTSNTKDS